MSEGGKLTIATSNVEVDAADAALHGAMKPGSYVRVVVSDTGCGMDEQIKTKIFEPFFTTKDKDKGTGLGLSTVYGIVEQSGGNICVTSEIGRGTSFTIHFPRKHSANATSPRLRAIQKPDAGTETILVVEDEEAIRKVVTKSLEAVGYTVLSAAAAGEALQTAAQHAGPIHLLLTDVVMPRMSGRALAQELARVRPTIKVLYMSGHADNAFVHNGVVDDGTPFIGKPFGATDMARKIREVLDSVVGDIPDVYEQAINTDAKGKP
jgi:CheY-like chemotaxis protein